MIFGPAAVPAAATGVVALFAGVPVTLVPIGAALWLLLPAIATGEAAGIIADESGVETGKLECDPEPPGT